MVHLARLAVDLQHAVDGDRLPAGHHLEVFPVQALGLFRREPGAVRQLRAHRQVLRQPGGLAERPVAGDQAPIGVAHRDRLGNAVDQCALERQAVLQLQLGAAARAHPQEQVPVPQQDQPEQRQPAPQQPEELRAVAFPDAVRRRAAGGPAADDTGHVFRRDRQQGLVEDAQQLRVGPRDAQGYLRRLQVQGRGDAQVAVVAVDQEGGGEHRLQRGVRLPLLQQRQGIAVVVHLDQLHPRELLAHVGHQRAAMGHRHALAVEVREVVQPGVVLVREQHEGGTQVRPGEVYVRLALDGGRHGGQGIDLAPAHLGEHAGDRRGRHHLELQAGTGADQVQQVRDYAAEIALGVEEGQRGQRLVDAQARPPVVLQPAKLLGREVQPVVGDGEHAAHAPAPQDGQVLLGADVLQHFVDAVEQRAAVLARGEGKADAVEVGEVQQLEVDQVALADQVLRAQGVADVGVHLPEGDGFQGAAQRVEMHHLGIGEMVGQLLRREVVTHHGEPPAGQLQVAFQAHVLLPDDHRLVQGIRARQQQVRDLGLEAGGAADQVDLAILQRLDGLAPGRVATHLDADVERFADQPEVVGGDPLQLAAADGDDQWRIVRRGHPHHQRALLAQPLPVRLRQLDPRPLGKRRGTGQQGELRPGRGGLDLCGPGPHRQHRTENGTQQRPALRAHGDCLRPVRCAWRTRSGRPANGH